MDTLTHALSGALLARATAPREAPPRSLPRRIAAGFFACAAPDLDFVLGFLGPVQYIELHRGPTHSLVLLPFWALVFSWVLAKILREPAAKDGKAGWRALYGVTALGIALHIAGDVITSFSGAKVTSASDLSELLQKTKEGDVVDVGFKRGAEEKTAKVRISGM